MGLYGRLLEEARGLPEAPERRGPPEGGYVGAEELEESREQRERREEEVSALAGLVRNGPGGFASALALGALRRRYPLEYAAFVSARRRRDLRRAADGG